MSIVIRPLEDADHEAWDELFRAYTSSPQGVTLWMT
jgi:hypothetical protein